MTAPAEVSFGLDGEEKAMGPGELRDPAVRKVLVVDRKGDIASGIARAAAKLYPQPEMLRLKHPTQLTEVVAESAPDVLVAGPAEATPAGLKRLQQVHMADPRMVILLFSNGKPLSAGQAAACGASDIMAWPETPARMRTRLRRALDLSRQLKAAPALSAEAPASMPAGPPPPLIPPVPVKQGRVFTIASASGGCGKTFFATNFTEYLARATGGKVLLVDLDLQFGEVATALQLQPERTIAELVGEKDPAASLHEYVCTDRSGFSVLCAPKDPWAAERVGPREATAVLESARSAYDYIVVDTPPSLNEVVLAALDQSQSLVLMATMDLPSLKNLRVFLKTLEKLNVPAEHVSIVLNKAEQGAGIDPGEVEPLYPQGFAAVLPYSRDVSRSLNTGTPVVKGRPESEIARRLIESAKKLVPPAPEVAQLWETRQDPQGGWWKRFTRGEKR